MKVIIPMSGIGKRFTNVGYLDPKPLIDVDGSPMIYHVVDLFPGETDFTFICNEEHLEKTAMREIILKKVPSATIVSVPTEGRKGPVHAVSFAFDMIPDSEEVIVSYCDYGTVWDYKGFLNDMRSLEADGGIASYIGFHPHMLGTDNYAFMKHSDMWVTDIQEKKPFTADKMSEYASNGTYYFRSGALVKKYFQKLMDLDMNLNGEYYVSLVYKLMVQDSLKVRIFEIEKMLQWGTPYDLEVYKTWSQFFSDRTQSPLAFRGVEDTVLILPMAGAGSRFQMQGYLLPKPLLPVEGTPMVVQAVECLPPSKQTVFITLQDHLDKYDLHDLLVSSFQNTSVLSIDHVTEGQACTCDIALSKINIDDDQAILISACDNGVYYNPSEYYALVDDPSVDVIVWSFTNNPTSMLYPQMYAWLDVDTERNIREVSVKKPFTDRDTNHCIIGTMFFRKASLYREGLAEIYEKNIRTNGEFYVDNLLNPLIQKGYKVKVFEVKNYLCWGTPNDYKTYTYWSEHFASVKR
jgi:bifunctional N-acetylglucosamine-1-phosphate-uridyltransferase/glucosamine-1-phosphate-acetyltransferase GlmU-like protein